MYTVLCKVLRDILTTTLVMQNMKKNPEEKEMEVMLIMNLHSVQQKFIKVPICAQNVTLAHTPKLLLVGLMHAHEFKSCQQCGWRKTLEC